MSEEKKQAVADRLAEIASRNDGRVTPEMVLTDAQEPDSPFHDMLDWDNEKAAHSWRLNQCRIIIRSVRYVAHVSVDREVRSPRYIRDPEAEAGTQGYRDIVSIKTQKDVSREALQVEIDRIMAMLIRASAIAEVLGLMKDLEVVFDSVARFRSRLDDTAEDPPPPQ